MKTKALISFAVTAKLICVFVFACAKSRFSHDAAHLSGLIICSQRLSAEDTGRGRVKHYDNTPMKYTVIFYSIKKDNYQLKNIDLFLIFAKNRLRVLVMNVYPESMF